MKYLLGVDFGGGASKATLLSTDGVIVATNTVEYPTHYPQAGYAEQNPSDWYSAIKENIAALLNKSGINPSDILSVFRVVRNVLRNDVAGARQRFFCVGNALFRVYVCFGLFLDRR